MSDLCVHGHGPDDAHVCSAPSSQPPICGVPCHYGGLAAVRKYSKAELGWMWHCNRRVKNEGDRCWQHREQQP